MQVIVNQDQCFVYSGILNLIKLLVASTVKLGRCIPNLTLKAIQGHCCDAKYLNDKSFNISGKSSRRYITKKRECFDKDFLSASP